MDAMKVLGLDIKVIENVKNNRIPIYITNLFNVQKVNINGNSCLMLIPKEELPDVQLLKKIIDRLQTIEDLPIFLKLTQISYYRKINLLSYKIPFILLDKLAYLPFMGTYLTQYNNDLLYDSNKFTRSSQLLFIWILYQKTEKYYISDAASFLGFSNMTLTRAYRTLVSTGLFTEKKDGRKIYLITNYPKKELFEKAKKYFQSPIVKRGYIKKDNKLNMVLSGESLLSKYTFLNEPKISEFAIDQASIDTSLISRDLIDSTRQVKIELWNYDPLLFSKNHKTIDKISLVISLLDNKDERVEIELEKLLDTVWEELNGRD